MPSNIHLTLTDDVEPPQWFTESKAKQFIAAVLDACAYKNWELSVLFTSDTFIRSLNKKYRNIDTATDVLSFCQNEGTAFPQASGQEFSSKHNEKPNAQSNTPCMVAGDLVISFESVERNAQAFSVPFAEELQRVLIHGILHLAGYDHVTNDASEPMLMYQERILKQVLNDGGTW